MRVMLVFLAALFMFVAFLPADTSAGVSFGVSADEDGLKSFYLAIGEHFQAPQEEVILVRQKRIPDEELPVVYFLARRADVKPRAIIDLRLGGKSWMDITLKYGLTAEIYYVELKEASGPPYGKAYGHYKHKNRKQWGEIRLADDDIVNFVNLKFISNHYGYSPDEVARMRENGSNFVTINSKVKKEKAAKAKNKQLAKEDDKSHKGKGKDKKK